jgi:hypothetical protein
LGRQPKLAAFSRLSTEELIASLRPGEAGALKVKPDGTIMDGHHRVYLLRERGVDVGAHGPGLIGLMVLAGWMAASI